MANNIVCFGEVLLRLSAPGRQLLLQNGHMDVHIGGAEANVAVSLSKLGHDSALVTSLPNNSLGRACRDELRRHGVDTSGIEFRDGRMGLYFLTPGSGQRTAEVLYDRAYSAFATAPADLHDWNDLLSNAQWLHVSGITLAVSASGAAAALRAMTAARAMNVRVSFDCNFRSRLWGARAVQAPQLLRELCAKAEVIFGDDRDIAFILGYKASEIDATERRRKVAAAAFQAFKSLRWMAYTKRSSINADVQQLAGALHNSTAVFTTKPYLLNGIVDRMGTGDAFAAGILHGLMAGFTAQATVEFATAAAGLKHTVPGDFNLLNAIDIEFALSGAKTDVRR